MPWVRLDDAILDNHKIAAVGPIGFALHVAGITHCARNLTDGFVSYGRARTLLAAEWTEGHDKEGKGPRIQSLALVSGMSGMDGQEVIAHTLKMLCEIGLWDEVPHGYLIHDYLDYNPSKEEVLTERAKKAAAGRVGGQRSVSTRRSRYGTAQPEADSEAGASTGAQARSEAHPEAEGQALPKPVPVPVPKKLKPPPGAARLTPTAPLDQNGFVGYYVDECRARGYDPVRQWRDAIGNQAKRISAEKPPDLIRSAIRIMADERKQPGVLAHVIADIEAGRSKARDSA